MLLLRVAAHQIEVDHPIDHLLGLAQAPMARNVEVAAATSPVQNVLGVGAAAKRVTVASNARSS